MAINKPVLVVTMVTVLLLVTGAVALTPTPKGTGVHSVAPSGQNKTLQSPVPIAPVPQKKSGDNNSAPVVVTNPAKTADNSTNITVPPVKVTPVTPPVNVTKNGTNVTVVKPVTPPVVNVTKNVTVTPPVVNVTVPKVPVTNKTNETTNVTVTPPANVTKNVTGPATKQTVWYWNSSLPVPSYVSEWNGTGFPPPAYGLISYNGSTVIRSVSWNGTLNLTLDGRNLTAAEQYDLNNGIGPQEIFGEIYPGEELNWSFNTSTIQETYNATWGWQACFPIYVLTSGSPEVVTAFALAFPGVTADVDLEL